LKQCEAGLTTAELWRQHGITEQTYYRWKGKYCGMEVSEGKRLRQLEEENHQLKHIVAELLLDKRALQAVVVLRSEVAVSERRACGLIQIHRGTYRYLRRPEDGQLRVWLRELAEERRRFGYRRLQVLLVREGWVVNHKRVYRL
jgi:putative transposase